MLQGRDQERAKSPREGNSLEGVTVYVPRMCYGGAKLFCAAFQSVGVNAQLSPASDEKTLELGGRYLSGEECYPEKITLGDFMKVIEAPDFDPDKVAFFMPTADGPCRFGQYAPLLKNIVKERGLPDVWIVSPTSENSYGGVAGDSGMIFLRSAWRALVCGDILRKLLLKTRPYEKNKGETDAAYEEGLNRIYKILAVRHKSQSAQLINLVDEIINIRQLFRKIETDYSEPRPLIGVVGEIFCRLNTFSNEDLIRKIEEQGGEAWLSDVAEWLWYTTDEHRRKLILDGKRFSFSMLGLKLKQMMQSHDEHKLYFPFREDFRGYEEPSDIRDVLKASLPYLPYTGSLGEMTLSVGKAIYLYTKGADGIIDISPFTCMNGIISEAVYPKVSEDFDNLPIRNFYFDGTSQDLERDLGIFMELAKGYRARKLTKRILPRYFRKEIR
jgi:predicted nucleotide-binding protein (sugar kinase/HSP70/actin superfamily)